MRYTTALICLVLPLASWGCYVSSTPLGPPGRIDADAALVGEWRCVPPPGDSSDEQASVKVFSFDASQQYVEWTEKERTTRYRVYGTPVGARVLLNVSEVAPVPIPGPERVVRTPDWMFIRHRIDAVGQLELAVVRDEAFKGLSQPEALNAIRARAADEAIYERFAVCTRRPGAGCPDH